MQDNMIHVSIPWKSGLQSERVDIQGAHRRRQRGFNPLEVGASV